ncbi:MAG: RNA methyltransferase [Cyanobium sp.]
MHQAAAAAQRSLAAIRLVLVEPAGPLNVGSVARLCANYGLGGLRLVAPRCDPLGVEARRMAVHGRTLLEAAVIFPTLAAALADCRRVVACSGRLEGPPLPLEPPASALAWLLATANRPAGTGPGDAPAALVFGREDRGLSNDELLQAGRLLTLATDPGYPSLNLSHAVAVVLHELHGLNRAGRRPAASLAAASGAASPPVSPPTASIAVLVPEPEPCAGGELEAALADAEALLLEVGFLLPHTARARMAKLRTLLQRARIRSPEVALLRGMVAQLRWASRRHTRQERQP